MGIGARDIDRAGFERLAQRVEHGALKLGQFIEKQHAQMRQADFARLHLEASAGQRGHAGGMMRRAEGARAADLPAFKHACN